MDAIARAWTRALGRVSLDTSERWNEAGGDSLNALRMWLDIEGALGLQLPFGLFDERTTAIELAATVETALASVNHRKQTQSEVVNLVCLQKGNEGSLPIYCLPTASGFLGSYIQTA
jgi:acyl carrier protein